MNFQSSVIVTKDLLDFHKIAFIVQKTAFAKLIPPKLGPEINENSKVIGRLA